MKSRRVAVVAAITLLAACVGDDPAPTSGSPPADAGRRDDTGTPCTKRSGTFVTSFTEKVGTCGSYQRFTGSNVTSEELAEQPSQPKPPCTGAFTYGADNCTETIETSCPSLDATTGAFTTRGTLTWNVEGTRASGDLEVSTSKCVSTYSVLVTKN